MSSSTLIPVSEYLSTSYRPDRDYIDGVVLERNVGEKSHGRLQAEIAAFFVARKQLWSTLVLTEQRVQISPTRFRIPDVAVLVSPYSDEEIVTEPPFLCIEILAREDTLKRMQARIDDYLVFGVSYIWVIDPLTRRCFVYTAAGVEEILDGVLRTSNPEFAMPLNEIFD
jgi:Uma2 family endonuclease